MTCPVAVRPPVSDGGRTGQTGTCNITTPREDATMTTLNITPVTEPDELHMFAEDFAGNQSISSTDVFLMLDPETGEMWCGPYDDVSSRHAACCPIPVVLKIDIPVVTADRVNRLMQDVAELAQQVLDGAELGWRDDDEWRYRISKGWATERQARTVTLTESAQQVWQQIDDECRSKDRFPAEITLKPGDLRPSFWEALLAEHGSEVWTALEAWRKQR